VIARLLTETPRAVRALRPGVSPHLERVVASTLAKLPANRIASAERLVAALQDRGERGDDARDAARPASRRLTTLLPWGLLAVSLALLFLGSAETRHRLHIRALATGQTRAIEGTEGSASPFFSSDSRWIAFFAGQKLLRSPVDGGRIEELAPVEELLSRLRNAVTSPPVETMPATVQPSAAFSVSFVASAAGS